MLRVGRRRVGVGLTVPETKRVAIMVRESLEIVANQGCCTRSHIVASHSCMPLRSCTRNHSQVQAPSYRRPQTLLKICPCDWPSVSCAPPEGKPSLQRLGTSNAVRAFGRSLQRALLELLTALLMLLMTFARKRLRLDRGASFFVAPFGTS